MKIRFANESEDLEFLRENLITAYDDRIKLGCWGTPSRIKNDWWESSFIAEEKGIKKAYLRVSLHQGNSCVRIEDIFVISSYRRRGIGKKLTEFAEKYIRNTWDARMIDILTVDNIPMEKCVKKMGYISAGKYDKFRYVNGKWYSQSRWIKEL